MPESSHTNTGFSLVELSIVLVILGLLVGGILSGQSLIRAAELRAVVSEYQRYKAATNSFRDKYFALPGDMPNATSFWGYSGGAGCTNSSGTAVTSPGTCDGNGDGTILHAASANQAGEAFQAWRQLALAGLIEGSYTGVAGPTDGSWYAATGGGGVDYIFGTNSPRSKIKNTGWGITYFNNLSTLTPAIYTQNYWNWMVIGASDGYFADDPIFTPSEAWNIDTKLDDGLPDKGSINTRTACASSGQYLLSSSSALCALIMKL